MVTMLVCLLVGAAVACAGLFVYAGRAMRKDDADEDHW